MFAVWSCTATLNIERSAGNYKKGVEYATYVLAGLTLICFLLTMLMYRRIAVAVACLKVRRADLVLHHAHQCTSHSLHGGCLGSTMILSAH